MARRPRFDAPNRLHHVMNRGIARRTVFETRADSRYFLSLLAREVRAGRLRVYAYVLLTTHFHLLIASPQGDLAGVMQRVMNRYVRYFNRTRGRDGSLFRGRFRSRPVLSILYRYILSRYIDQNPVNAGIVADPRRYPYGSAIHFAARRRPPWLDSAWVDRRLDTDDPGERYARHGEVFGAPLGAEEEAIVQARIRLPPSDEDDLDHLVSAAPARVQAWMRRKADLADQTRPGQAYVSPSDLLARLEAEERAGNAWRCVPGRSYRCNAWPIAKAGLLRQLAGVRYRELEVLLGLAEGAAQRRVRQHRALMQADEDYAARIAALARPCFAAMTPGGQARGEKF